MKTYNQLKYVIFFLVMLVVVLALQSTALKTNAESLEIKRVRAKVTDVIYKKEDHQCVELIILEGIYKNKKFKVDFYSTFNFYGITLRESDEVFVTISLDEGKEVKSITITNIARDKYMLYLFLAFTTILLLIGGFRGFRSIISLIITYFMIIKILLPLIIQGYNPIYITLILCSINTVISLILIGGFNIKTFSSILGTLCGLIASAYLAIIFGSLSHITGIVGDEFYLMQYLPLKSSFSYQGLLFSGIIIGSLGAVMDVSMSIASVINELKEHSHNISPFKLIKAGMNVGKDTIGTMTNTLILAYAGGAIDMLIIAVAENNSMYNLINQEVIATEILRTMAGSIGLLITVPLTAVFSGLLIYKKYS
nr:YibE/F family protein [Sedimentibacter sp.]